MNAVGATDGIPLRWGASYMLDDSARCRAWLDAFHAEEDLGVGVPVEYKPLPLPRQTAFGIRAYRYDGHVKGCLYLKLRPTPLEDALGF